MGNIRPFVSAHKPYCSARLRSLCRWTRARILLAISLACLTAIAGCRHKSDLDTLPLSNAGIAYDAVQKLKALNITAAEEPQIIEIRQAGLSDSACVALVQVFHGRNQSFDAADAVANFAQARIPESTILEVARLNQLGLASGELLAIHLAGLPDSVVLEVARRHAANQPVMSGVSLASIKNTGVRNSTLLELVRRGVPDSQAPAIVAMRRHRGTDAEILRHFSGS